MAMSIPTNAFNLVKLTFIYIAYITSGCSIRSRVSVYVNNYMLAITGTVWPQNIYLFHYNVQCASQRSEFWATWKEVWYAFVLEEKTYTNSLGSVPTKHGGYHSVYWLSMFRGYRSLHFNDCVYVWHNSHHNTMHYIFIFMASPMIQYCCTSHQQWFKKILFY